MTDPRDRQPTDGRARSSAWLRAGAILALGVVLVLLVAPAMPVEDQRPGSDKVAHVVAFGLVLWALGVLFRRVRRTSLALAALAVGAAVEVIQPFVGRDADLLDLAADSVGIAAALAAWAVWRRFEVRQALRQPEPGQPVAERLGA